MENCIQQLSFLSDKQIVKVELRSENIQTIMKFSKKQNVKDLFQQIRKKFSQFNPKKYIIVNQSAQNDKSSYVIDQNFPLQKLQNGEIVFIKKKFADSPKKKKKKSSLNFEFKLNKPISTNDSEKSDEKNTGQQQKQQENDEKHFQGPISEVWAYNYEEFNVQRINTKGEKIQRIIGIDYDKVYNLFIQEQQQGIVKYLWNTYQTYSLPSDVSISQIKDLQKIGAKQFQFNVPYYNILKTFKFETKSTYDCEYILAKLSYLISHQQKQKASQERNYNMYKYGQSII
ncbi:hypothetical protein PPERSA_06162 [Pseudocohnilembus persalinus]|uniref:SIN1-type PH domain-containing protein n=1 Tax=Pseudocohnilembus persalinus TaxID=266149 RepID=A0A0V0QE94_PSEPJ|nr:hypothetical protein PPERSA_06162 [Pseudocohnilembus persalinus]|eukprot:KRX00519.1 hypothetical protein PPERSA_06162 [Pseudocohnilembus persalinus]